MQPRSGPAQIWKQRMERPAHRTPSGGGHGSARFHPAGVDLGKGTDRMQGQPEKALMLGMAL